MKEYILGENQIFVKENGKIVAKYFYISEREENKQYGYLILRECMDKNGKIIHRWFGKWRCSREEMANTICDEDNRIDMIGAINMCVELYAQNAYETEGARSFARRVLINRCKRLNDQIT